MNDPQQVLDQLIEAFSRQDIDGFIQLCQTNAETIFNHFSAWAKVPEDIRDEPEKVNRYVQTMIHTAKLFEGAGYPQLMDILMPPDQENPLEKWEQGWREARQLTDTGDYEASVAKIDALLRDLETSGLSGPGLIDARAKLYGLKGEALSHLHRYRESREAMQAALKDCEELGDEEGIQIYAQNLEMLDVFDPESPELLDIEIEVLEAFAKARKLTDLYRFQASNRVLTQLLERTDSAAAVVDSIRPHILGRMGFNEFKLNNPDVARQHIEKARDLCRERDDKQGAEVYEENLQALDTEQESPG